MEVPRSVVFAKNSTFVILPVATEALAEAPMMMFVGPMKDDPLPGVVMSTVGGVSIRRETGAEVIAAPAVSVATAVKV